MPLKTLFLNPPSFENFDGGASSRWPATREIESYWYPVWLTYPAGLLEGSRLLDAPPHHISADETIKICKDYEFLVLFTSTVGWEGDQRLAEAIKAANPSIRVAFVGPPVTTAPEKALNECSALDFICRREFDYAVVEFAQGSRAWSRARCTGEAETVRCSALHRYRACRSLWPMASRPGLPPVGDRDCVRSCRPSCS